jgi:protein-S-isoprenylcysteine O-methyltransferase Ste14
MKIKGIDKFREKLPALRGRRIIILPIYTIICIILIFFTLFMFFHLIRTNVQVLGIEWNWIFPILGVVIIEFGGLIFVYQMWFWRDRLKAKYQRVFFIGFAGILCMICLAIFNMIPLAMSQFYLNSVQAVTIFIQPISNSWFTNTWIFDLIRIIIGIAVFVLGFLTMIRSFLTFGFDYMTVVYLYFPEESSIQNNEIYSVMRHPTYAGLIYVSFAGVIIQFSLYSMIFFILYLLGFGIHILKVEEKELIQRFGESFKKYRKEVPAILVRPRQWGIYFKFLTGKE